MYIVQTAEFIVQTAEFIVLQAVNDKAYASFEMKLNIGKLAMRIQSSLAGPITGGLSGVR